MKKYLIALMISMLFFTGCEDIDFNFGGNGNDTEVTNPDDNTSGETNSTDDNVTEEPVIIDKREFIEVNAKEWYVRIVVEDTTNDMKTAAAQLGQLEVADVVINHTLKAIAPFRPTFLNVVFDDPVGVDTGSYTSNFHASGTDADTWEFTIKSHDSSADMILGWRGLYVLTPYIDTENRERYTEYRSMTNPLLQYMTLVDVTNGDEIDVLANGTVNEYVFNMNGVTERTFRWKVKDSSIPILPKLTKFNKVTAPKQSLQKIQVKALRKDAKSKPDALKKKRVDALDMMSPPVFEVLVK